MKMQTAQVLTRNHFGVIARSIAALILSTVALSSAAQNNAPLPFTPAISTEPTNAPQNTPRVITVQGQWPNGCPPSSGTMTTDLAESDYLITIALIIPQTLLPCTQAITSYTVKFNYTPQALGVIRVMVKAIGDGVGSIPGGAGTISTSLLGQNRGIADVSGMWYDPNTNGSGVSIIHNYQGVSSGLFAAWFAYDSSGNPRWLTIQEGKWEANNFIIGNLYETKAAPNQCNASMPLCVARYLSLVKIGTARLSFTGIGPNAGTPPQATIEGFDLNGSSLLRSSVLRMPL